MHEIFVCSKSQRCFSAHHKQGLGSLLQRNTRGLSLPLLFTISYSATACQRLSAALEVEQRLRLHRTRMHERDRVMGEMG